MTALMTWPWRARHDCQRVFCCRGRHESVDLQCQHAEALLLHNASGNVLHAVLAAIESLLRLEPINRSPPQ